MINDFNLDDLTELQRVAWIYACLIGVKQVTIRLSTGSEDGLGFEHPNLGKWCCYVDIGPTTFSGTVVNILCSIRDQADKRIGRGYL